MDYPIFANKEEELTFVKEHNNVIIAEKKMQLKYADAVSYAPSVTDNKSVNKASSSAELLEADAIKASLVINTTNWMDSHKDVHLKGIWNKSVKEQKGLYLLEEHKMSFKSIISDNVKAVIKEFTFKELGFNVSGSTQALVFDTEINKDRNPFMFEQYAKGYVKNHSVGMRYVKIALAVNSDKDYYKEEKATWDKYYELIANKTEADASQYFYAVTEAKVIEGSAVPLGSNTVTPTLTTEVKEIEPSADTQTIEPDKSTQNGKPESNDDNGNLNIYDFL